MTAMVARPLTERKFVRLRGMTRPLSLLLFLFAAMPLLGQLWEGEVESDRWPVFISMRIQGNGGTVRVRGVDLPIGELRAVGDSLRVVAENITIEGTVAGDRFSGMLDDGKVRKPIALTRFPDLPAPKNRLEAWGQDLDALVQRFLRADRSFSTGERARFVEEIEALRKELPKLDDPHIIMRIASAVSLARNAHTRLYLVRNRTEVRRLPIRVWWFDDGLYVVRTTPEYRKLLGCRIDDLAGTGTRHARDIVAAGAAGNPSWRDYKSAYFLTSPEALYGFGIAPELERVEIGLSGCGEAPFRATVAPLPLVKKSAPTEAWWDLSPLHVDPDRQWVHVLDGMKTLPLYLRDPERYYWFEFLPESGILYFHYNRASDMGEEKTKAFGERLLAELAARPVKALVVDLRFNTGGNEALGRDLMRQLHERTPNIPRYIVTGRATFSAGMSQVALWKSLGNVKLIGEPIGEELDYWSEGGNIILPNSGLYAHFANGAHSYSERGCPDETYCYDLSVPTLAPDVPLTASWEEYRAGRDVVMETVLRRLAPELQ